MTKTANIQRLIGEAKARLNDDLDWYQRLPGTDKELLNLIVQTAVVDFVSWFSEYRQAHRDENMEARLREPDVSPSTDHLFFVAPFEFTQSISLRQTLDTVRLVVDSLEDNIDEFAEPDEHEDALVAMLYYSREVAFSAANIYAQAAEARGAWDARLEALIIEDLIDGTDDPNLTTRLRAADWDMNAPMFAIVGGIDTTGNITSVIAQDRIRAAVHDGGAHCMMSMRDEALVVLVALGDGDGHGIADMVMALSPLFSDDSLCVGPLRSGVDGAAATLHAALNARRTACALPDVPRPLSASDVLPERALAGDADARAELYDDVYLTLRAADETLFATVRDYLLGGCALEATARRLNVHPNTVRYRLNKAVDATGWDPTNPRDAYVLLTAIKIGLIVDGA